MMYTYTKNRSRGNTTKNMFSNSCMNSGKRFQVQIILLMCLCVNNYDIPDESRENMIKYDKLDNFRGVSNFLTERVQMYSKQTLC